MNSERRDRCSWDRSAVGSGMSEPSGYSFRAEAEEYYRNRRRRLTVNAVTDIEIGDQRTSCSRVLLDLTSSSSWYPGSPG